MNDEDSQSFSNWVNEVGFGNYADHDSIPIVPYDQYITYDINNDR